MPQCQASCSSTRPHFLGKVWKLARPYWHSEERWRARGLLAAIVALTLGLVYMAVLFNDWNREFYNSLEQKNFADFKDLLLYFCFLAAVYIAPAVYKLYLTQMLEMRWRVWLTRQYLGDWLDRQVYYRLELENHGTDNPDQRIAEDLRLFTDGTLNLALGLLTSVVTLVSFVAILWSVSGPLSLCIRQDRVHHPGLHGLGRARLRAGGERAHALHRPTAHRPQLPAGAPRGGFPLQPGAAARERRGRRAVPRRSAPSSRVCSRASN